MAAYFYMLLVLSLALNVDSSHDRGRLYRYGCIFSPAVCVPPEDCNGLTGHCEAPVSENHYDYGDLDTLKRAVESFNYQRDFDGGRFATSESDETPWEGLTKPRSVSELHRNAFGAGSVVVSSNHHTDKENTHEHINQLLDEVQNALAKKGKKLSDLRDDEVRILVTYLSNVIKNDMGRTSSDASKRKSVLSDTKKSPHSKYVPVGDSPTLDSLRGVDASRKKENGNSKKDENPVDVKSLDVHENTSPIDSPDVWVGSINEIPQIAPDVGVELEVKEDPILSKRGGFEISTSTHSTDNTKIQKDTLYIVIIVVGATVLLIVIVTIISCIYYMYRRKKEDKAKFIQSMTFVKPVDSEYQDLCRHHYATENSEVVRDHDNPLDTFIPRPHENDASLKKQDTNRDNSSMKSSVSSMSWSTEPVNTNLDINTAHVLLSYMEDHLEKNNRLAQEWEEICNYKADHVTLKVATAPQNKSKNRSKNALPYDSNRVKLKSEDNHMKSDYINASKIIDNDPKRPLYIATQGPLPSTVPDFWQMMWEQRCVAIVMLTALDEDGEKQCARYWPDVESCTYHNFVIKLVSEHIWCEDYLVRSLYLKHTVTGETRTVTQFHFLSWPNERVPSSPKRLLEFRRKVTKCQKAHNSPVLVHCSDGISRTGTYILLDLVINRMLKQPKEIDIAATLEHIRDQRVGMVGNKEQFEFALTAVADEVNAILDTMQQ